MHHIKQEDIESRNRIEKYFSCPGCGNEISDYDIAFADAMECPDCKCEIYLEGS